MSVFFNGRLFTTPVVASRIDDSEMVNKNLAVGNVLAIIGQSGGGESQSVMTFSDAITAKNTLISGELLTAVKKAFSPSSETGCPQTIKAIRVNPSTQSRLVIGDGATAITDALQALGEGDEDNQVKLASDASAVDDFYTGFMIKMTSGNATGETNLITGYTGATKIASLRYDWRNNPANLDTYELVPCSVCLESTDFGEHTNQIRVKIQDGATTGTKKLYLNYGTDEIIEDNIGNTLLTLTYDGAAASALLNITASSLTVSAGVADSEVLIHTFLFSEYSTLESLVNALNGQSDLTAVLSGDDTTWTIAGKFDFVEDTQLKSSVVDVTANLDALITLIESNAEPYMNTFRPATAGVTAGNFDWTYFKGGSVTTPTTDNYQSAINLLQSEDVQCVVALSSDASVHAMVEAHCIYMSNSANKERRGIAGGALSETLAETTLRAKNLNNDRMYLVSPGYKDYNDAGVLTTYAPYMFAAVLGGMITGSNPGESLTNKSCNIQGLEKKYLNPADTDDLIKGGVTTVINTNSGYRVVKSVSTWLRDSNYNRVEMGTGFAVDYIARNVREALETLKGGKGNSLILARAVSITENTLIELARPEPLGPEVIVGDTENPAYQNITAKLEGDVLRVYFQCSPVIPVNYVLIGISVTPYAGSASIAQ